MGDVITWSKLNKITKMVKNLPNSLTQKFEEVRATIFKFSNKFDLWSAPWTTARAENLDKLDNIELYSRSTMVQTPPDGKTIANQETVDQIKSLCHKISYEDSNIKMSDSGVEIGFARTLPKTIKFFMNVLPSKCIVDINMQLYPMNGTPTPSQKGLISWEIQPDGLLIKTSEDWDMSHDGIYCISWKVTEFN